MTDVIQSPRLEVSGLSRSFGGRAVVRDVDLTIAPGQVVCLLGASGCGKSTTLRMIAGVERAEAGRIAVDGQIVADGSRHLPPERRNIGLMFQDFALFPHLDVAANVGFGLKGPREERAARVAELLDRVDMTRHAGAWPGQLSGGEQQRVALARALAPRPRVMLMDEPFSGLDDRLRDDVRDATLALLRAEGTAVLLVTHEPPEAMRMADRILLMRAGRIVQAGSPAQIYARPADRAAAAFFSDINIVPGTVRGGMAETAFGRFAASGLPEGAAAEVVIRPQHLKVEFDRAGRGPSPTPEIGDARPAQVLRARFVGRESLVEFRLEEDGARMSAIIPGLFLPAAGRRFWLALPRARAHVFAAEGSVPGGAPLAW